MPTNEQDPAASTQQFHAFARRGEAGNETTGRRVKIGLIVVVAAVVVAAVVVIALLI